MFHITNFMWIVSRMLLLCLYDNYYASMVIVALGSAFYPVGIRVSYTVSEFISQCKKYVLA